jgi:hypothetical protein
MNSEKVNDWLQIVGMIGIMASLIFVGFQVRQTQSIGEGESASYFLEATIVGKQFMVDNMDVWTRGCLGEELSTVDEAKYAHMYRAYARASYFGWLAVRKNIVDLNAQDIVYPFAANIHRYPGFARIGSSWTGWAAEGHEGSLESSLVFQKAILDRVAELQRIDPNPDYDVKWCGS